MAGTIPHTTKGVPMTDHDFNAALTARINVHLDLPFLSEEQEAVAIAWCVNLIGPRIPDSIKTFVLDAADGLSAEELGRLEDILVNVLNDRIDIPWMTESMEASLLRPVVQAVLDLAKTGLSIYV